MDLMTMRKLLFFLFIFSNIITLFADGRLERDRQPYEQIQLKVVNLTDRNIIFYFNKLYGVFGYDRWQIRPREEFITMNTPINDDYPGFIGIQYNAAPGDLVNAENIVIYRYSYRSLEIISRVNRQYIVLVMQSGVQFIEANIDEEIDYYDESLYQSRWKDYDWSSDNHYPAYREDGLGYYPVSDWSKIRLGQRYVELVIENNSGSDKRIRISTVLDNQKEMAIRNGMSETYTIDSQLYQLGRVNVQVSNSGWVDNIILVTYALGNNKIVLRLNTSGHEVIYY